MKFSVQLYSLREILRGRAELLAVLPKLKAMGFDGVEFAGYYGMDAAELRAALDATGLVASGTHVALGELRTENLQKTIVYCKTLGLRYVGVGGAAHGTPEETAASCAVLQAAYEEGLKHDIVIYYHNHVREFIPFADGSLPIDSFMAACSLELDTCWSYLGGVDNYDFITRHRDRICLLHLKDVAEGCKFAALGDGTVDVPAVVRAARECGIEWLVLEDETTGQGIESVARGAKWLRENV
ncbi:MAG: sugar phosphate isomerase/epimerase [Oscillospiraceae bacterium]|jgi:sugar phosphate isomerase/epimerase|nr:sugar phosphate isomerase/epimerase [Oscillospiraceae bacterium]